MSIKHPVFSVALSAVLFLGACETREQEDQLAGAIFGGAAGLLTAKALGFGDGWVLVTTAAGAAAGTLIAQNAETNECAYSDGAGGYTQGPCP